MAGGWLLTVKVTVLSVEVEAALELPAASVAALTLTLATTVPLADMPLTRTVKLVPVPLGGVTLAVSPVSELSLKSMSAEVKPLTLSLKTTVNPIGPEVVGSAWALAWLMETVGATRSNATTLSVLVEADVSTEPAMLVAAPAGIVALTVPVPLMPVTVTVYAVVLAPTAATEADRPAPPPELPERSTSLSVKPVTPSENTTSNTIGVPLVGSAWLAPLLIVTPGPATVVLNNRPIFVDS